MALETSYMVVRVAITQSLSITEYTKQAGVKPCCTDVHANTGEFTYNSLTLQEYSHSKFQKLDSLVEYLYQAIL